MILDFYLSQKGDSGDVPLGIHYVGYGSNWQTYDGSSLNYINWAAGDHDDPSQPVASFSAEDSTWQAQSEDASYKDYICQIQSC